jgi:hypothetical protein
MEHPRRTRNSFAKIKQRPKTQKKMQNKNIKQKETTVKSKAIIALNHNKQPGKNVERNESKTDVRVHTWLVK